MVYMLKFTCTFQLGPLLPSSLRKIQRLTDTNVVIACSWKEQAFEYEHPSSHLVNLDWEFLQLPTSDPPVESIISLFLARNWIQYLIPKKCKLQGSPSHPRSELETSDSFSYFLSVSRFVAWPFWGSLLLCCSCPEFGFSSLLIQPTALISGSFKAKVSHSLIGGQRGRRQVEGSGASRSG